MKKEKAKNEKKGNNKKLVLLIAIAMLLVATVGATFAYFASRTEVSNTLNVVANIEHDNGTFITTATKIDLNVTSASMQEGVKGNIAAEENGVLNVEYLSGTENGVTCKYDINYEWVSENSTNPYMITNLSKNEFTYEITDGSNTIISERNFVASSDRNKHKLGTGYIYNADTTNSTIKNYTINAKFYNIDEDQSLNADKNWTLKFYVDNVVCGVDVESTYTLSGVLLDDNNNPIPNATLVAFSEPIFTTTDANGRFEISGLENENHNIYFVPNKSIVEISDLSQGQISALPDVKSGTFTTSTTSTIIMDNNYSIGSVNLTEVAINSGNNGGSSAVPTIDSCPDCKFIYTTSDYNYGSGASALTESQINALQNNYENVVSTSGKPYFLGFKVNNVTGVAEKAYACGILNQGESNEQAFCVEGNLSADMTTEKYQAKVDLLNSSNLYNNGCNDNGSYVICNGSVEAYVYVDGSALMNVRSGSCDVNGNGKGYARCY